MFFAIAGTIVRVALTVAVIGALAGAAMFRVLDRTNPMRVTEDGAVVEPIYESPTPEPTKAPEPEPEPVQQRTRVVEERVEAPQPQAPSVVVIDGTGQTDGGHVDTGNENTTNSENSSSNSGGGQTDGGHTDDGHEECC